MNNPKMNALAKSLNISVDEIKEEYEDTFDIDGDEYRVLTDSEADQACEEQVKSLAWAFNSDFIASHTKNGLSTKAIKALQKMQGEMCEDAQEIVLALVEDENAFIQDAVRTDGRGHFLASYDGEEHEVTLYNETFYIYRMN